MSEKIKMKDAIDKAVEKAMDQRIKDAESNLEKNIEQRLKDLSKDAINQKQNQPDEDKELVSAFYKALATRDPQALADVEKRIKADYKAKSQNIGNADDGGILVPESVSNSIQDKLEYVSPLRRLATVIPNMPAKMRLQSGSLPQAYWVEEEEVIPESNVKFTPRTLAPHKAAALDTMSSEFLQDAETNPAVQNYIEDRFVLALALLENAAFVNGDGTAKPLGFRSSAITPKIVVQTGAGLDWRDLVRLKYANGAAFVNRGTFLLSAKGIEIVESLKDKNGRPIYRESIAAGVPSTLLNRPVEVVDEIPSALGTGSDETEIWYNDMKSGYTIGDRGARRVDYGTSGDDFARDRLKLRVIQRVAGAPAGNYNFAKLTGVKEAPAEEV